LFNVVYLILRSGEQIPWRFNGGYRSRASRNSEMPRNLIANSGDAVKTIQPRLAPVSSFDRVAG